MLRARRLAACCDRNTGTGAPLDRCCAAPLRKLVAKAMGIVPPRLAPKNNAQAVHTSIDTHVQTLSFYIVCSMSATAYQGPCPALHLALWTVQARAHTLEFHRRARSGKSSLDLSRKTETMKNTANTPDVSFDTLPFLPSLLREREKETELLVEHGGHIGYYILYASFGKLLAELLFGAAERRSSSAIAMRVFWGVRRSRWSLGRSRRARWPSAAGG